MEAAKLNSVESLVFSLGTLLVFLLAAIFVLYRYFAFRQQVQSGILLFNQGIFMKDRQIFDGYSHKTHLTGRDLLRLSRDQKLMTHLACKEERYFEAVRRIGDEMRVLTAFRLAIFLALATSGMIAWIFFRAAGEIR